MFGLDPLGRVYTENVGSYEFLLRGGYLLIRSVFRTFDCNKLRLRLIVDAWFVDCADCIIYQPEILTVVRSKINAVDRAIGIARRRILVQQWLTVFGWLLLLICSIVAVLILANRLLAIAVPRWMYGATVMTGPLIATWVTWWRWPSGQEVAMRIDQSLKLQDRLASALYASSVRDHPFARRMVNDAQRIAMNLPLTRAFPVRLVRIWGYLLPSTAALVVMALWMPQMDLVGLSQFQVRKKANLDRTAAMKQQLNQIEQDVSVIDHVQVGAMDLGTQVPERHSIDVPDALSKVNEPDLIVPTVQPETDARLSRRQDRLVQSPHELVDTLQNIPSRLERSGPGDRLAKAVERGDFQSTQEAVEELIRSIESMSDQDRQALERRLKDLAQQLQTASEAFAQEEEQTRQQIQKLLPDAQTSLSPTDRKGLQSTDSEVPSKDQRQLESVDGQKTDLRVRQLKQLEQKHKRDKQVCQELSQGLGQASRAIDRRSDEATPEEESAPGSVEWVNRLLSQARQLRDQLDPMHQTQRQVQDTINHRVQSSDGKDYQVGVDIGGKPIKSENRTGWPRQIFSGDPIDQAGGRRVGSWQSSDPNAKGPSTFGFDESLTDSIQQAEQAVTEERVPRRYHDSIRQYFNQLPGTADPSAPITPPQ